MRNPVHNTNVSGDAGRASVPGDSGHPRGHPANSLTRSASARDEAQPAVDWSTFDGEQWQSRLRLFRWKRIAAIGWFSKAGRQCKTTRTATHQ